MVVTEVSESCPWCLGSDLYRHYHDTEWGVPCRDSQSLFELINLEGAQAGLSWITILNKREAYRELFHNFDPLEISQLSDARLHEIAADTSIVRHKGKVFAVRENANALLAMQYEGRDFSDFVWSFVDDAVQQHTYKTMAEVPAITPESSAMSHALKQAGFKFVGPTTCYAFMQAAGMVNDHLVSCPRHRLLSSENGSAE